MITGYHAVVDPSSVGLGVTALVGIHPTDTATDEDVADALGELDEVESCYAVAGDEAFVVKVRVPTVDELERTLSRPPAHPRRRADEHHRRALDPLRGPPEQRGRRGRGKGPAGRGVTCVGVSDEKAGTLPRDLTLYLLARFVLVGVIGWALSLVGVPLLVALLIGLVVGLPLGLLLFRPLNARVTAGLAKRNENRARARAQLRAQLRGDAAGQPE